MIQNLGVGSNAGTAFVNTVVSRSYSSSWFRITGDLVFFVIIGVLLVTFSACNGIDHKKKKSKTEGIAWDYWERTHAKCGDSYFRSDDHVEHPTLYAIDEFKNIKILVKSVDVSEADRENNIKNIVLVEFEGIHRGCFLFNDPPTPTEWSDYNVDDYGNDARVILVMGENGRWFFTTEIRGEKSFSISDLFPIEDAKPGIDCYDVPYL